MKTQGRSLRIVQYRDFYDIPQMFLARRGASIYLFECIFEDSIDDYEDHYSIYLMPPLDSLSLDGSWVDLAKHALKRLGEAKKTELEFDSTRRAEVTLKPGVAIQIR